MKLNNFHVLINIYYITEFKQLDISVNIYLHIMYIILCSNNWKDN